MSAVIVRVPELNAFAASIADTDLFHFVDVSDTTDDASGSSFRLTPAQLRTYLNQFYRSLSGTIPAAEGYALTAKAQALGSPYTPTPSAGNLVDFTGSGATPVNAMTEDGVVTHGVTAAQVPDLNLAAYTVKGATPTTDTMLQTWKIGTKQFAIWLGD